MVMTKSQKYVIMSLNTYAFASAPIVAAMKKNIAHPDPLLRITVACSLMLSEAAAPENPAHTTKQAEKQHRQDRGV